MSNEFWSALNKKKREELLGSSDREELKTSDFISSLTPEKQEELLTKGTTSVSTTRKPSFLFNDDIAPVSFDEYKERPKTIETTQAIYDKYGKYYHLPDYDEYSKKGADIENPTFNEAEGLNLFGWRPFSKEVSNIVTYSRDNVAEIAMGELQTANMVGKSKYRHMTDFEVGIYNYLLAKEGEKSAQKFLDDIEETLNAREGGQMAETIQSLDPVSSAIMHGTMSVGSGIESFGIGVKQLFSEEALPTTATAFTNQALLEDLDGFSRELYLAGNTVGNMAPSVAVGFLNPTLGMATQGASAAGGAYGQARKEGYSKEEAATYGVIIGGMEFATSKLLSGVSGMTGKLPQKAMSKIATFENGLLRTGAKYGISLASEITEEEVQLWLEPFARTIAFGEDYDAPELEEMAETAIVTAISTGILNSTTDAITGQTTKVNGLTQHEAQVINTVVDNRIAEEEKSGRKLSSKEKEKIYNDVVEQMDKGQLDIDTIESVLGGETYNTYTSLTEQENDLISKKNDIDSEISDLIKTPETQFTIEQRERLDFLREESKSIDENIKALDTKTAKTNLFDEVYKLTEKDTRLRESYNERARRGQAFEADLTQYTGKQREAVERAIKSGVLNNTNRSHELVNTLSKIEADKGIVFDYTNNEKLKEAGFALEGKTVNGLVKDGGVTLNVQSSKAWQSTVGHEITHVLEGTEAYSALREAVYAYAESKGELASRKTALTELYKGMNADIDAELTADLVGDYLFTNKDFINKLTGNRTLFQKVWDEVKYLCKVATGKELTEIEKVEREFARAWKEQGQTQSEEYSETDDSGEGDITYSISVTDKSTRNFLDEQVSKGEYNAETNPDGGYYVTYKSMSFWGYDEEGNAILRSPMAEYVDGELSNAYLIPKDKSKLNWYQSTETIDENTGLPSGLLVKAKQDGKKSFSYLPASENQHLINEDWSNLYFNLRKKVQKNGKWVNSDVPARYNPYEHSSNSMLNDQFSAAYLRDNLVTVKMYVPVSEDNGTFRAKYSKDATGWADWKTGTVAGKINKQKDLQRKVYLSRYAAPVEIVPDSEVAQAYKEYLDGTDVTIPDNVVSPNLLNELKKAGVPITESGKVKYSVSVDSNGNELSLAVQKRFANSKAVDENGNLKVLYHGTASGEFFTFDKAKGSVEGDFGSGFYFTDNEGDVEANYEGGGPDFENKVARRAEQIEAEEDIDYSEAKARAREELYVGSNKFEVYLNIENPAIVGKTYLLDYESFAEEYDRNDYDSDEDYEGDVEQLIADEIDSIIWDIERNVDIYSTDGIADVLWNAVNEGGIGIEQLKKEINDLYLEDNNGNMVGNEVTRQIIESLGYDGIIDNTVSSKFNMGLSRDTTHYIVFKPNQIKDISNQNPTDNPDIRYSLSNKGEQFAPTGNYSTPLNETALEQDIAPVAEEAAPVAEVVAENATTTSEAPMLENIPVLPDEELEQGNYAAIRPKPAKQPSLKKISNTESQNHIAQVLTEEPKVEKKKKGIISTAIANFIDKGAVFENLSLKTKNRALQDTYKAIGRSETKAQYFMENGTKNVKSLDAIRAEVEKSGKVQDFYNYIYHKHNIDRMNLESKERPNLERLEGEMNELKLLNLQENQLRAIASEKITKETSPKRAKLIKTVQEYLASKDIKNKPVFDYSVTSEMSQEIVNKYEAKNPEFKEYAQDVYDYMNHLRKMMIHNGIISQETANLWAEMYPHYVPIRRADDTGLAVNVPLDTNKTGINAPIKRATGGNSDILPLFETMAQRTSQTFKAIDKNRFGVELKNTLGGVTENIKVNLDEVIDSIDTQDSLLQEGKNGRNPTFTVFEGGDRVTFDITEEMYDALKPTSEGLSYTNKVLNTASNLHRGVLTEYSVPFMVTNAIKDAQDVLINSQHPAKTYGKFPTAINELRTKGKWYTEYMENGGGDNTYFDKQTNTFNKEKSKLRKVVGFPLDKISDANNFIEKVPRLAEYIASRENGASIDAAMLDAARITTDFSAGGDVTKFLNRNGATFLNASVQGFAQQVRNVREAKMNGLKGWLGLATKYAIAGLPALLLNSALWDDDEEYEELSDYVKENYYIVGKYGDGKFVRIPKGRALAVIQNGFEQVSNALTGNDEVDFGRFFELFVSNLAPNNPLDNNIIAPIKQVMENKTWYGEDLVPSRLQDLPNAEQYDESTDSISKWLGENLNVSPYKINYLLNQYSGGVGDIFLPMLTPEAESGDNSLVGNIIAPLKDKFTTDSVMNNQNVSDFYDTVDVLTKNAKSSYATDEDILKSKYINSVNTELGDLYKSKREIQNSNLSDSVKYKQVRNIQEQINNLAKNALNSYENVDVQDGYATVGDKHYRLDDGVWTKISAKQLERQKQVTRELGISPAEYWSKTDISYFPNSDGEYEYAYDNPKKYAVSKVVGGYNTYKTYSKELYNIKADKDENGKSINGSRKEKVLDYINNLDADYETKIILLKSEYPSDDTYNMDIINYINERGDLTYEERIAIFTELGFTVENGTVYW